MTPQEIFEAVVKHMVTMGHRAGYRKEGGKFECRYRTNHGAKCVAGMFIPDELYNTSMEGLSIGHVLVDNPDLPKWMHGEKQLLSRLQLIHDRESWDRIEPGFQAVAEDFELDASFLAQYDFTQFIGKEV
jgi:hypothetical protein